MAKKTATATATKTAGRILPGLKSMLKPKQRKAAERKPRAKKPQLVGELKPGMKVEKFAAGQIKWVHVNPHAIRENHMDRTDLHPTVVAVRPNGQAVQVHAIKIIGGDVQIRYDAHEPKVGASVFLEITGSVELYTDPTPKPRRQVYVGCR